MIDNNIACRKDLDLNAFAREMCLELRRLNLSRPSQIERIARNARLACLEWLGSVTATAKLAMPRHFDVHAPTYEDAAREIDDMSRLEYSHDCVYALANERGFRQRKTDDEYRKEYANILHKFELGELPKYKNAALQIEDKNNKAELEQQEKIYMQWLNDEFRNDALAMIPEPFRGQAIEAFAQWKRNKEAGNA